MILRNAKEAFSQIQFKHITLNKPPIGDCFFQLKGLEVDVNVVPFAGSPDDGYEWKGPVKRSIVPVEGGNDNLEVTQFFGGRYDAAPSGEPGPSVLRVEYRIPSGNNRVFLVHYLLLDGTGAAIIPDDAQIPAGTVNPAAIFGGHVGQAVNSLGQSSQSMRSAPKPTFRPVQATAPLQQQPQQQPRPVTKVKPSQKAQQQSHTAEELSGHHLSALDDDGFDQIEMAHSRAKFIRSVIIKLFPSPAFGDDEKPDSAPSTSASNNELAELMEMQAELLRVELSNTRASIEQVVRAEKNRRDCLNAFFDRILDASSLDDATAEWEAATGCALAPTTLAEGEPSLIVL